MSLVTVQRSPDSASDGESALKRQMKTTSFMPGKVGINHIKATLSSAANSSFKSVSGKSDVTNVTMKTDHQKTNRISTELTVKINKLTDKYLKANDLTSNTVNSSTGAAQTVASTASTFNQTVSMVQNSRKKFLNGLNLAEFKRASFNLDDRPKSNFNFNDLKAIYSNKQHTSATQQLNQQPKNFNKLQSNTIPLNRSQINHVAGSSLNHRLQNSNLFINRLSLNLIESNPELSNSTKSKFQNNCTNSGSITTTNGPTTNNSKLKKFSTKFKSFSDKAAINGNHHQHHFSEDRSFFVDDEYAKNMKPMKTSFTLGSNEIKKLNKLNKMANLKQQPQQQFTSTSDKGIQGKIAPSNSRQLIEKYFVVKDAALILPRRSSSNFIAKSIHSNDLSNYSSLLIKMNKDSVDDSCLNINNNNDDHDHDDFSQSHYVTSTLKSCRASEDACELSKSFDKIDESAISSTNSNLQEAASTTNNNSTGDILLHLQSMISLLRPHDTITLAVKLCSYVQERIRYLVIVETRSNSKLANNFECEESALLGLELVQTSSASPEDGAPSQGQSPDANNKAVVVQFSCSVGMVLPIYANCEISLDGDGGFKFKSHHTTHIFKPVSIQAMWSAYQYLHKAFENARKYNFYSIGPGSTVSSPLQAVGSANFILSDTNNQQNASSSSADQISAANGMNNTMLSGNINTSTDSTTNNHEWAKYYSSLIGRNKCEQTYINEWYQKEERSAQREDFTTPYFDCLQLCKEQEVI